MTFQAGGRPRRLAPRELKCQGFTLVELMVSLAILAGMMLMVAMVFSSASKSSGQAQSSAMINRHLQQITDTIRQDLEGMKDMTAGPPILGIAGVEIPAAEKPGLSGTSLHRADVLMLVTQRPFKPYVYASGASDTFVELRQVVYGHANFGKLIQAGGWIAGSERQVEGNPSPIPASQWHLARRVIGFPDGMLSNPALAGGWPLTDGRFTGTANNYTDVCASPFAGIANAAAGVGPPLGHYRYRTPTDLSFYCYFIPVPAPGVGQQCFRYEETDPPSSQGFWYFWNQNDGFWYVDEDNNCQTNGWIRTLLGNRIPPAPAVLNSPDNALDPLVFERPYANGGLRGFYWPEWFYTGGDSRVRLDPAPPAGAPERMAAYFLPGCSEFKVEFTYDDPREIAINSVTGEPILTTNYDQNGDGVTDPAERVPAPTPIRWQTVPSGALYVWYDLPTRPSIYPDPNPGTPGINEDLRDLTFPYLWPRALRITLRAYDPRGALDQPVTYTIVHVFD